MSYLGEFRASWRAMLAACIGMSTGYTINNYTNNVFIPRLIGDFGWTASQVALIGVTVILAVVCQPLTGRITDAIGARAVAALGIVTAPLIYVAMSALQGSFALYLLLSGAQVAFVAATTAAVVYARIVASSFDRALGLALAIVTCSPPVIGALLVPALAAFIDHYGWRAGYWVMAGFTGLGGACALAMAPREASIAQRVRNRPDIRTPLAQLVRSRTFQLIIGGMVLCNLTVMMQTTQLAIILQRAGLSHEAATLVISIYALGVMGGRLICGLALDRFPTHSVTAVAMGLPAVGLFLLSFEQPVIVVCSVAVVLLGASIGAEGDLAAYLVRRYFPSNAFGTVLGCVMGAIALAGAAGSLLLSVSLATSNDYQPFLVGCACAALLGACSFLGLPTRATTIE